MDAQRFDRLTRQLTAALSRRRFGAILPLLGLTAGSGVALVTEAKRRKGNHNATAAKKKGKGKGKKKPKKCKKATIKCGKKCVNPKTNALHCGGCGQRCGTNRACVNGQCEGGGCPGSQILCHELCVDSSDNEDHCGRCNNPCADSLTCVDGECGCADGELCDGDCVDLQTDDDHCGSCGNACDAGENCESGQCNPTGCGAGERFCQNLDRCIPEDDPNRCCVARDCGGIHANPYGDLECTAQGHCVCKNAGEGRCSSTTVPSRNFLCDVCCEGGGGCPAGQVCNTQGNNLFCECDRDNGYVQCTNGCKKVNGSDTLNCGTCDNVCRGENPTCRLGKCCGADGTVCGSTGDGCCSRFCRDGECGSCSATSECGVIGEICSGGRCCTPSGGPCHLSGNGFDCCSESCEMGTDGFSRCA